MRNNRGSALLVVSILGVMMVLMAIGLISFSSSSAMAGYRLDMHTVTRYAAETGIQDVKANLKHDAETSTSTWFTTARLTGPQPCDTKTVGPATVTISLATVNAALGQYRADVMATMDGSKYKMSMTFSYVTTATAGPSSKFSKYATFVNDFVQIGNISTTGYYHSNNYISFTDSNARFFKKVTAANYFTAGGFNYFTPYSMPAPWSSMFQSTESPSHDPNVGVITPPTYASIDGDLRPIAMDSTKTPPALWVDPANAAQYPGMLSTDYVEITFAHNTVTQLTTATINVFTSGAVLRTTRSQVINPAVDTLIYTPNKINNLKGTLYGRVLVSSGYKGTYTASSVYNGNSTLVPSAVIIRDDLIYVDQNGNPETWIYQGAGTSSPVKQLSGKYNFPGIPFSTDSTSVSSTSGTWHVNNMNSAWDNVNYGVKMNPNFNAIIKPCLGIIGNGDIAFVPPNYNQLISGALYVADPQARIKTALNTTKGNLEIFGSRTSQLNPFNVSGTGGFTLGRSFVYDDGLQTNAPPFFVSLPGASTGTTITVTYGSMSGGPM